MRRTRTRARVVKNEMKWNVWRRNRVYLELLWSYSPNDPKNHLFMFIFVFFSRKPFFYRQQKRHDCEFREWIDLIKEIICWPMRSKRELTRARINHTDFLWIHTMNHFIFEFPRDPLELRLSAGDCRCFPWIAMDRKTENINSERLIQSSFHCSVEAVLHNSRKSIDSELHLGSSKSRNISDATFKWKFFMFACKCWKLLSCQWSHAVPWNPFCQCSGKCLKKIDNIPFHFWCVCWLSDSISTLE